MKQLTKEQAIEFHDSGVWKDMSNDDIVKMQLYQDLLCVPFDVYHSAITEVFGRSVYTHEFANQQRLIDEYEGKRTKPTLDEIIDMIPKEKRIIFTT